MSDITFASKLERRTTAVCIADINEPDAPLVYVNQAFSTLTGYSASYCVGRNCRFLQCDETDPDTVTKMRVAVENRHSIEICVLNQRESGELFHNFLFMTPFKYSDGGNYFLGCQYEINPKALRIEHHLKNLNNTLGFLIEDRDPVWKSYSDAFRMRASSVKALVETYIMMEMGKR